MSRDMTSRYLTTRDLSVYMKGDGVALCEMGAETSQFETLTPAPTCNPVSELKCGRLNVPLNGDVVYKDANTGYFTCDAGYTLMGAEEVSFTSALEVIL